MALGLHAAEYGLRVLRRQVGALNAHVDDGEAKALGAGDHLVADVGHQRVALVAHDVGDRGPRQRAPERKLELAGEHVEVETGKGADARLRTRAKSFWRRRLPSGRSASISGRATYMIWRGLP